MKTVLKSKESRTAAIDNFATDTTLSLTGKDQLKKQLRWPQQDSQD